ncbi:MAG: glycosyltransferase, partial [Actinomycetota bacterium]
MRSLAVLSMHTSPLAQPGYGDGGGMNVYVRELAAALARSGSEVEVFTRADRVGLPAVVEVEPGFRVHHLLAGPQAAVDKFALPDLLDEFADAAAIAMEAITAQRGAFDAIHANYWLSGAAGHSLKHRLDLPLVATFHTLDRVKAEALSSLGEGEAREQAEQTIMGCADALLASCLVEADQLTALYGADEEHIHLVPPAVDHAFFGPGNRAQARKALGLPAEGVVLLFVGRIQALKGIEVAVSALGALVDRGVDAHLVVVGGPSGPDGEEALHKLQEDARNLQISHRLRIVAPQPHELLSSWYRAADACIVPSRAESFGLVALEAQACGTPVVASAVGGLTTLVADGITGFLVDGRDPVAFA